MVLLGGCFQVHRARSKCENRALVPGRHSIAVEGFKGSRSSLEMKVCFFSFVVGLYQCYDIAGCNVRNVFSV